MRTKQAEIQPIQAVDNALTLMEVLADEEQEAVPLSELALRLGLSKTRTFRLLATLESRGYVERTDERGRYGRGPASYDLAPKTVGSLKLLQSAHPAMQKLAEATGEAVYLGVEHGGEVLFLDFVDTAQQIRGISLLCRRYPLQATAVGTVLTGTGGGHCLDHDALAEGLSSIAVPIGHGEVRSALNLVGPSYRLPARRLVEEMLPPLREAARTVGAQLGRRYDVLERCRTRGNGRDRGPASSTEQQPQQEER